MGPIGQIDADFVFTYFHQEERAVASLMLVMESFLSFKMHPSAHSSPLTSTESLAPQGVRTAEILGNILILR